MIAVLLNVIAPVLICVLIGFFWGRSGTSYATEFVTRMITFVGAPCLIIATINKSQLQWQDFLLMAKLQVMVLAGTAVIGFGLFRLLRLDFSSLGLSVVMPNVGNMGLSLCLFAFGEEGLALALIIFVVTSLIHFASGDLILSRD
ncbi:MAG: transporter, partial [Porticoccaceae bacterium]|nr:transporter [Porticoccaceae bacterium]